MLSGSRLVRGVARRIESERSNAERAIQREINTIGESFAGSPHVESHTPEVIGCDGFAERAHSKLFRKSCSANSALFGGSCRS